MKLPQNMRDVLPKRTKGKDPMIYAKFFDPFSGWKWFVMSLEGKEPYEIAFCLVHGFAREMGDVYLHEIEANAEVDLYFTPKRVSELKEGVDY